MSWKWNHATTYIFSPHLQWIFEWFDIQCSVFLKCLWVATETIKSVLSRNISLPRVQNTSVYRFHDLQKVSFIYSGGRYPKKNNELVWSNTFLNNNQMKINETFWTSWKRYTCILRSRMKTKLSIGSVNLLIFSRNGHKRKAR